MAITLFGNTETVQKFREAAKDPNETKFAPGAIVGVSQPYSAPTKVEAAQDAIPTTPSTKDAPKEVPPPIPSTPSDPTATLSFGNKPASTLYVANAASIHGILEDAKISLPNAVYEELGNKTLYPGDDMINKSAGKSSDNALTLSGKMVTEKALQGTQHGINDPSSFSANGAMDVDFVRAAILNQQKFEIDAIKKNTDMSDGDKKAKITDIYARFGTALGTLGSLDTFAVEAPIGTDSVPSGGDPSKGASSAPVSAPLEISTTTTRYVTTNAVGFPTTVKLVDADGVVYDIPTADGGSMTALVLGMSPETLSVNSTKVINRYQTLTRWVEEHWGDELDQVSFSGSSFGFVTSSGYFLTPERRDSGAYKELKHLVDIYRQNGGVYQEAQDPRENRVNRYFYNPVDLNKTRMLVNHPRAGMLRKRLYVQLTFDFAVFTGYFESFNVDEDASKPFSMQYSASFKSEKTSWM